MLDQVAPKILRMNEVLKKTAFKSRSSIYAAIENGNFPKPIRLGEKAIGFIEAELDQWILRKIAERDTANPPLTPPIRRGRGRPRKVMA